MCDSTSGKQPLYQENNAQLNRPCSSKSSSTSSEQTAQHSAPTSTTTPHFASDSAAKCVSITQLMRAWSMQSTDNDAATMPDSDDRTARQLRRRVQWQELVIAKNCIDRACHQRKSDALSGKCASPSSYRVPKKAVAELCQHYYRPLP